jgi:hypothetical protein
MDLVFHLKKKKKKWQILLFPLSPGSERSLVANLKKHFKGMVWYFVFFLLQQYSSKGTRESGSRQDPRENSHSAHSAGAISSSVHDLSPTLWHALDVWRCTNHLGGGLAEALRALATCGMGLSNENWYVTLKRMFCLHHWTLWNVLFQF